MSGNVKHFLEYSDDGSQAQVARFYRKRGDAENVVGERAGGAKAVKTVLRTAILEIPDIRNLSYILKNA